MLSPEPFDFEDENDSVSPDDTGFNPSFFGPLADQMAVSEITPQIFISDFYTARNSVTLKTLGITHVVSVIDYNPDIPSLIPEGQRLHISIDDMESENIVQHFDTTTSFISDALEENRSNKVLVHCGMGMSRSPTVVCAYLIAKNDMSAAESVKYVHSLRRIVCPNEGFQRQLEEYAKRYNKDTNHPPESQCEPPSASVLERLRQVVSTTLRKFRTFRG